MEKKRILIRLVGLRVCTLRIRETLLLFGCTIIETIFFFLPTSITIWFRLIRYREPFISEPTFFIPPPPPPPQLNPIRRKQKKKKRKAKRNILRVYICIKILTIPPRPASALGRAWFIVIIIIIVVFLHDEAYNTAKYRRRPCVAVTCYYYYAVVQRRIVFVYIHYTGTMVCIAVAAAAAAGIATRYEPFHRKSS